MTQALENKKIILGISGSIAAYKACEIARGLIREGGDVTVLMTEDAARFITPLTFEALTKNQVYTDIFTHQNAPGISHIELARTANLFLIAPATAHTIAKLAGGFADDIISLTTLTTQAPVVVGPAMNTVMYGHIATQKNIDILRALGYHVIEPDKGELACGDEGSGRLADTNKIIERVISLIK